MISALKTFGIMIATVLLLSITIKDKPLFSYIYDVISPATKAGQSTITSLFDKSLEGTQDYSKKLFDNSVPKVKDAVKSQLASQKKNVAEPAEKILDEEKEELDQLIKNHRK